MHTRIQGIESTYRLSFPLLFTNSIFCRAPLHDPQTTLCLPPPCTTRPFLRVLAGYAVY